MPSATAKGFPYPVGVSDALADTDLFIKALADFLEARVGVFQSGSATSASLAAGAGGDVVVNFGTAFNAAPNVVVSARMNGSDSALFPVMVKTKAANTFTARVKNGSGAATAVTFDWIANG